VSAVGHEVDVTLCDFAADARAATPSQAAEMVVPDARARRALLGERKARLARAMRHALAEARARHARLAAQMGDPRLAVATRQQLLDERTARLHAQHPRAVIARELVQIARADDRLRAAARTLLTRRANAAHALAARLDAMSPLKVLGRGYAIATRADGRAIRAASEVASGDEIQVRIAQGVLTAEVRGKRE
jgi:exodeoxyribonuclease VII large subunit